MKDFNKELKIYQIIMKDDILKNNLIQVKDLIED
jgi:hypothetical protein